MNWCPAQGTVLANEEVKDGRYVETGDPVERRLMRQWMLRITAYAERLLADLDGLDWPESIKAMQRHWIGRSEGADVTFPVDGHDDAVTVFTTRPETLWGATCVVLAPEHPLVARITAPGTRAGVDAYAERTRSRSDLERTDLSNARTGVATGAFAINPATGDRIPIWVADYVLPLHGTGAIMAVPAHDARDHGFARAHGLPVVEVVTGGCDVQAGAWDGDGVMVNSPPLDGRPVADARRAAIGLLQANGWGSARVSYRLRDWLFSRQRYWGEPIPILHLADGRAVPLPEGALPLLPPELDDYRPADDGRPPLARARGWVETTDPASGQPAERETDTMPQWAGSCWYYLRYLDPHNAGAPVDPAKERYWMPVDLYVGGAEHAVLHLLYARFWHKVLFDIGVVSTPEPFQRLSNQGMILAHSYRDAAGRYHPPGHVAERDGRFFAGDGEVTRQTEKMSKSRFNVVDPDDVIAEFGADALRLYEMFMGPLEATKPWQTSGVSGVRRFLERAWRIVCDDADHLDATRVRDVGPDGDLLRLMHRTIRHVTEDIEALRFNTAVARLMAFGNALTPLDVRPRAAVEALVLLLSPFAPHVGEELWGKLGHGPTLAYAPWPVFDAALARDEQRAYVVQVNGKLRHRFVAEVGLDAMALISAAKAEADVTTLLDGKTIVKQVAVPGRLVSFVVRG